MAEGFFAYLRFLKMVALDAHQLFRPRATFCDAFFGCETFFIRSPEMFLPFLWAVIGVDDFVAGVEFLDVGLRAHRFATTLRVRLPNRVWVSDVKNLVVAFRTRNAGGDDRRNHRPIWLERARLRRRRKSVIGWPSMNLVHENADDICCRVAEILIFNHRHCCGRNHDVVQARTFMRSRRSRVPPPYLAERKDPPVAARPPRPLAIDPAMNCDGRRDTKRFSRRIHRQALMRLTLPSRLLV